MPAGTFIVPLAQPAGRLARNLLDPDIKMDDAFLKEQDRRRKARLPDQIYDVTAWSLPLMFDVDVVASDRVDEREDPRRPGRRGAPATTLTPPPAGHDRLPDAVGQRRGGDGRGGAARGHQGPDRGRVVHARAAGSYAIGTAFVRFAENPEGTAATLQQIAQRHGAELVPIAQTWTDEGISLGSGRTARLRAPRVLLAWDAPVSTLSAGFARYVLEQRFGLRVTAMRTATLQNYDMKDYDVLVLPSATYSFSDDALRRLKDWIRNGGTLITIAEASRWAARDRVGLLSTDTLLRDGSPERDAPEGGAAARAVGRRRQAGSDEAVRLTRRRFSPSASGRRISRARCSASRCIRITGSTAGLDGEIQTVYEGARVFAPLKLDAGVNVGVYAPLDQARRRRPGLAGGAAAARRPRLPDAPADGPRPRDRVRGGAELPRLRGSDAAALHQRGAVGRGALGRSSA